MKRNKKILLILSLIILISITCFSFVILKQNVANNQEANLNQGENNPKISLLNDSEKTENNEETVVEVNEHEDLINISECSEEFMEEYFEEIKEIEDKENVLIVSSKEKIENTYGATKIIEAPNNQYFIEYNSEEEKNQALEQLKNSDAVLYVEENNEYTLFESDFNSWGIEKMGLDSAIQIAEEEKDLLNEVTVAIIDTGCNIELFNENYPGKIKETRNFMFDGTSELMYDNHGHGTHIAGTIAEGTPSNVNILPAKVSDSRTMYTTTIIAAVNYITYYEKADVINMSFGADVFDAPLYIAIDAALEKGIISVAAAGNDSSTLPSYPAAYDNTISVSAVDSEMNLAEFSNYGNTVTFTAPGVEIESINGLMSGTSMATPHVVCATAMLKSVNKSLSLEQIITVLKDTAIDIGDAGWDKYFGYGLINLSDFNDLIEDASDINIVDFEIRDTEFDAIYGNITNLMGLKMILKDTNGNEYIRYFSDLEGLEIEDYDAFIPGEQQIKIKYNNIEKTIIVNNGEFGGDTSAYLGHYTDESCSTLFVGDIILYEGIKKIYIPEFFKDVDGDKSVVGIYDGTFKNKVVDAVILPSTITSIGNEAFYNSTIKTITGGAEEISVGDRAFYNAYGLEKFPATISSLGESAFYNVSKIESLKLSNNIETFEANVFYNCVNLENIDIPDNLVEIKDNALAGTKIKTLNIPKTLTNISETAFRGITGLETIKVDSENPAYDSRENCNAIIETSSDTIILGSANTTVPDGITTIGEYAFYKNNKIKTIHTNEVDTIGNYAFQGCSNLEKIYLGELWCFTGVDTFADLPNVTVYAYNVDRLFGLQGNVDRGVCIIPGEEDIKVISSEKYRIFDKADDIEINIDYYGWSRGESDVLHESITEGYQIAYQNGGDCFKRGDRYFTVSATTEHGIKVEKKVEVILDKAIPEYTIPTDLKATEGQRLSEIELPSGFEWMDETQVIEDCGKLTYNAKFIPDDRTNYEIVENIEIIIEVKSTEIKEITVNADQKEYKAFEKVNAQDVYIMITYESGRIEYVRENIAIEYPNGNESFRYGDTYIDVKAQNKEGNLIEGRVEVTIQKAVPQYTIPTNIEAIPGQQLSQIELPNGFEWMDETQIIEGLGEVTYNAKYIPEDTTNYEIVENIEITINVKNEIDGKYVGNINSELITFNVGKNHEGATYVSGQVVVVEWVDGISTVPEVAPKMKFKSTDGTVELEVFVTPTGTNTYYFDRFIEGIDTSKEYFFEIESGNENNVSPYKKMNVYFTNTKYNNAIVGKYHGYNIKLLKQNIIFEKDTYIGNINSELITFNVGQNHEGATYVSGQIVVVEWVNGKSTVPEVSPKMRFKSTDGTINMEVFVTPTGTNTYYFDRFIEGINTSKEYFFEIESGDKRNISENRSMNVYFTQTKYNDTIVGRYHDKQIRLLKQKILFEDDTYIGNINSELITFNVRQNHEGATYVSGQIVVVEWVNGKSTVPEVAPKMKFKSTDGTVELEVFVTPTGTNTYYFDRFIEGIDTSKEYFFEIESGDERNISENRSMNVYFTQTKYNDTVVGFYKDKQIRLLKQNIIFENYQLIYITKTGSKYHYDNSCNGGTYILSTLKEAIEKGLKPCEKCVI